MIEPIMRVARILVVFPHLGLSVEEGESHD
jgi:hypothetical protein